MSQRCDACRYWSEMVAYAQGGGPVMALCLSQTGPQAGKYTAGRQSCGAWKDNRFGAIDCPPNYGEESRAAYEAEEGPAP